MSTGIAHGDLHALPSLVDQLNHNRAKHIPCFVTLQIKFLPYTMCRVVDGVLPTTAVQDYISTQCDAGLKQPCSSHSVSPISVPGRPAYGRASFSARVVPAGCDPRSQQARGWKQVLQLDMPESYLQTRVYRISPATPGSCPGSCSTKLICSCGDCQANVTAWMVQQQQQQGQRTTRSISCGPAVVGTGFNSDGRAAALSRDGLSNSSSTQQLPAPAFVLLGLL